MIRRRLYAEIRVSKLALWSRRIAIFALPVVAIAVFLHRLGAIEYNVAYVLLAAGFAVALAALVFAVFAFAIIWNEGLKGLGSALTAFVIAAGILAVPLFEAARSINLPAISDVTTDFADPPRFNAIAASRPRSANSPLYPGGDAAQLQRAAYPAVRSAEFDAEPDEMFNVVAGLAEQFGWRILDSVSPRGGERDGYIEAVALTAVMGFREDISIRIRKIGDVVRIDMRSASRYGSRDFGSNARRIRAFMAQIGEARRRSR
jgi:uncharacterized protein (DUF1499 family)